MLVLVRQTCLYVATVLGDCLDDIVIVGGLVPALLIEQQEGIELHVGTRDLDLGLALAILEEDRYHEIAERLRQAGFSPDINDRGNPTRQRWKIEIPAKVTVDFLIQPSRADDRPGRLRNIESDLAAFIAPGLHLAFQDLEQVTLSGRTLMSEEAERQVQVCGPGAFVVLKALALRRRGKPKDAYDLYYVVRNYGKGVVDVAARLKPLLDDANVREALEILREDFGAEDRIGPMRVARFLSAEPGAEINADVVSFMGRLLAELEL
jgi:hypothetical protein